MQNVFTGQSPAFLNALKDCIERSETIDIIVSFLMESGVKLLLQDFQSALAQGKKIRILTGDYLKITQPWALALLKKEGKDQIDLRFYVNDSDPTISFHPKAYLFHTKTGKEMMIGSSNLSKSALEEGVEWNYRLHEAGDASSIDAFANAFEDLFENHSLKITDEILEDYSRSWRRPNLYKDWEAWSEKRKPDKNANSSGSSASLPVPRHVQIEALYALEESRSAGLNKGLVEAATGIGKTYLAAFDSKDYPRVLFVAHRKEILEQACKTFHKVRPYASIGFFDADHKDWNAEILFASVTTLGKEEYLSRFAKDAFDYIVIDEAHHGVTASYQNIVRCFQPKFLLALTATPERLDGRDVYALCDYNVPYSISLQEAINKGLLAPFHYYGIYDATDYSNLPLRSGRYAIADLDKLYAANKERIDLILKNYQKYRKKRALGFCVSRKHADLMAKAFNEAGIPSAAVVSGKMEGSMERHEALDKLEKGELEVLFTVDLFNEGVDIPSVDEILMLRPTESAAVFLQQLGRGLRKAPGKDSLCVLDFIGNYRHAGRIPELLYGHKIKGDCVPANRTLQPPLDCFIDFDMQLVDLLRSMNKNAEKSAASLTRQLLEEIKILQEELGHRPSRMELMNSLDGDLLEALLAGKGKFRPLRDYFEFLAKNGLLNKDEQSLWNSPVRELIHTLETTDLNKVYKIPVLSGFLQENGIAQEITAEELLPGYKQFYSRNGNWRDLAPGKTYADFLNMTDQEHIQKIKSKPMYYLGHSSKGIFIRKNPNTLVLNERFLPWLDNPALREQWEDILQFRSEDYYRRRFLKRNDESASSAA